MLLKLLRLGLVSWVVLPTFTMLMSTHTCYIGTWHFDKLLWLRYLTFNFGDHSAQLVPMSTCIAYTMLRFRLQFGRLACRFTCPTGRLIKPFHMLSCTLATVSCLADYDRDCDCFFLSEINKFRHDSVVLNNKQN